MSQKTTYVIIAITTKIVCVGGGGGRHVCMVVGFTTNYAISAYHN
jgi:hypothetical protein